MGSAVQICPARLKFLLYKKLEPAKVAVETTRFIVSNIVSGDYSRSYAEQQRGYLENHILPHFGDTKLCSITITEIENWNIKLKNQYSAVTANRALTVLKIMLKEAKRCRLISYNPGEDVKKLPETSKEKGILTLLEFARPKTLIYTNLGLNNEITESILAIKDSSATHINPQAIITA